MLDTGHFQAYITNTGSCVCGFSNLPRHSGLFYATLSHLCVYFSSALVTSCEDELILRSFVFLLCFLLRGPGDIGVRSSSAQLGFVKGRKFYVARLAARLGIYIPLPSLPRRETLIQLCSVELRRGANLSTPYLQRSHSRSVGARIERRRDVVLGGLPEFSRFLGAYCRFLEQRFRDRFSAPMLASDIRLVLSAASTYCYHRAFHNEQLYSRVSRRFAVCLYSPLGKDGTLDLWAIAHLPRIHLPVFCGEVDLSETFLGKIFQELCRREML
uniref:P0 protein n=1 Tax=Phasey bean mild yellows virus TaxID=1756832 RepID=A0A8A6LM88_9VIRU|nr:P0 protein [Phasey bean mild yellows virus]